MLSELIYGVMLLTAITATPDISMNLRLHEYLVSRVRIRFPGLGFVIMRALLFTSLAMWPTMMLLPEWLIKHRFMNLLLPVPWISLCCLKFFKHFPMHLFTIRHVGLHDDTNNLVVALVIYCTIFAMSIEMMMHWFAIAQMTAAGNVVILRSRSK